MLKPLIPSFSDKHAPRHEGLDALEGMASDSPQQFQERLRMIGQLGTQLTSAITKPPNLMDAYCIPWAQLREDAAQRPEHYDERMLEIIQGASDGGESPKPTDQEINELVVHYFDQTAKQRKELLSRATRTDIADTAELIGGGGGATFENQEFTGLVKII